MPRINDIADAFAIPTHNRPRGHFECHKYRTIDYRSLSDIGGSRWIALDEKLAERVGFEPTVPRKGHNGFRDRPDRPLWHLSVSRLPVSGGQGYSLEWILPQRRRRAAGLRPGASPAIDRPPILAIVAAAADVPKGAPAQSP